MIRPAAALAALATALAGAVPAHADSPSAEAKALAGRPWSAGEHQAVLNQLEQRSRAFYDLLERGARDRAAAVWPELESGLAALDDELQARLDAMRQDVMDRDADIEELYRSARWREPEIMSLVATYHLAWVRYQGAQLVGDPARKKALLTKAVDGFSQFLLVNDVPDIYGESLYGRGLAFLDLGETAKAIDDLQSATEQAAVAGKARAALEEARRRAAGGRAPAENEPEQLTAKLGDLLPRAAAGDAVAEKDATTLARGLAVRGGAWPARVVSVVTERLGGPTPRSSYGLYLLAQLAVDRGRCADVAALAEACAATGDAARARLRPEILFLDAGCKLNGGQARAAAEAFGALLHEFPDAPKAREAAYYRVRALDLARTADPFLTAAYEEALDTYLARFARAEGAAEARFLRAELDRSRGDCARAAREYGEVGAGPFETRARLGALECRVASLPADPKAPPAPRQDVLAALRAFVHDVPARGEDQKLVARAALLGAAVAAGAHPPDHAAVIDLLDGFEGRYPEARDLHQRALELRLAARVGAGQLDAAEKDLAAYLKSAPIDKAERRRTLARLGREAAAAAERRPPTEQGPALAVARKLYAALVADGGDPADRIMLADLELRAGDGAAARWLYEQVLAADPTSAEALRGAARAAAAAGDRNVAFGYWRRVLDATPTGSTGWYEARLAQVNLLAEDGRKTQACELVHSSRGRATSAGADQMEAQLRGLEAAVCE